MDSFVPEPSIHSPSVEPGLPPRFLLFLLGAMLSNIGMWMQIVAEGWVVADLTKDPFWAGFVGFCGGVPILLLSMVGGAIADRFERRKLLLVCQVYLMGNALILFGLTYFGVIRIWHVSVLSFLGGIVIALNNPTYNGFLFDIVGKHGVTKAVSQNALQFHISRLIGPAIGGICLSTIGAWGCFLVNAVSFLAVLPIIALINVVNPQEVKKGEVETVFKSLKDAIRFVFSNPNLRGVLIITGITTILVIPHITLLPLYVKRYLILGPQSLGWMWAVSAGGSILVTFGISQVRANHTLNALILASGIAALCLFGLSNSRHAFLIHFYLLCLGACVAYVVVGGQSLLHHEVESSFRGRVLGIWSTLFHGMFPIGNIFVGSMAQATTIPQAWKLSAAVLLVFTLIYYFKRRFSL